MCGTIWVAQTCCASADKHSVRHAALRCRNASNPAAELSTDSKQCSDLPCLSCTSSELYCAAQAPLLPVSQSCAAPLPTQRPVGACEGQRQRQLRLKQLCMLCACCIEVLAKTDPLPESKDTRDDSISRLKLVKLRSLAR